MNKVFSILLIGFFIPSLSFGETNLSTISFGMVGEAVSKNYTNAVVVRADKSFDTQLLTPNTTYVIRYDFELKGKTIHVPDYSILKFEGGSLHNGKLIGNNTLIDASTTKVFEQISFDGNWIGSFNAVWLGLLSDDKSFDNGKIINDIPFAQFHSVYIPACKLFFSTPILIHNTEHFVCDADLYYNGTGKNVSIIKLDTLLDAKIDFNGTIRNLSPSLSLVKPLSSIVGIDLVDSYDVILSVKKFIGANECIRLMSTGTTSTKGCAYNKINLGLLANCNTGIRLYSKNKGWVNQNNIFGGRIVCQYGKIIPYNMRRIVVETDSKVNDALTVVGLSMEGAGIGIEATHLYGSAFVNCRFEGLDYAFVGHGTCRWNEIKESAATSMPKVNLDDCNLCAIDGRSLTPYMSLTLNEGESITLNRKNGSGNNQLFYRIVELDNNTHCELRYTKFTNGKTVPEKYMLEGKNTPIFFGHNRGKAYYNTYSVHFTTEITGFPTDIQELTLKAVGGRVAVNVFTLN